jgi:hypothetical protein
VRWAQPDRPFGGNNTSLSDEELNSIWYPRLPRQDSFRHDQERFGLSSGVQFRPDDRFEASVNWVHSQFKATTNSDSSFAAFRRSGPWGYPASIALDSAEHVVISNQRSAAAAIAEYLVGLGHRDLGYIPGPQVRAGPEHALLEGTPSKPMRRRRRMSG